MEVESPGAAALRGGGAGGRRRRRVGIDLKKKRAQDAADEVVAAPGGVAPSLRGGGELAGHRRRNGILPARQRCEGGASGLHRGDGGFRAAGHDDRLYAAVEGGSHCRVDVLRSGESEDLLPVGDQQIEPGVGAVLLSEGPRLMGVALLAAEVVDGAADGERPGLPGAPGQVAESVVDPRHQGGSAEENDIRREEVRPQAVRGHLPGGGNVVDEGAFTLSVGVVRI